ncbi:MAG: hypothetical protein KDD67_17830 [Ignavibacteriae bacterium]|nr:hypothetical protein [Ignavibacteriota bacterium]MCB9214628.1 hypothetical protein [Ignavibacteria bacterium]
MREHLADMSILFGSYIFTRLVAKQPPSLHASLLRINENGWEKTPQTVCLRGLFFAI